MKFDVFLIELPCQNDLAKYPNVTRLKIDRGWEKNHIDILKLNDTIITIKNGTHSILDTTEPH